MRARDFALDPTPAFVPSKAGPESRGAGDAFGVPLPLVGRGQGWGSNEGLKAAACPSESPVKGAHL
ncbi:hypothetical protein CH311_17750 [Afifella marina DSM 2698]|uniref:Uncharacterized protein n=1 Tax=Afifella marina DSM 2698 TaxID=1120955 RepID=A0A1G5NZ57_AFIMA|nr:hypothetical protein CH311_17750 [Afifella marina DSM 2698]SCZ42622.1 hypothetical protein SAMN03080610_02949 [Afifella marina DSM 2698]